MHSPERRSEEARDVKSSELLVGVTKRLTILLRRKQSDRERAQPLRATRRHIFTTTTIIIIISDIFYRRKQSREPLIPAQPCPALPCCHALATRESAKLAPKQEDSSRGSNMRSGLERVASQRDELGERGGDGGELRGGEGGAAAHGARGMEAQPGVDARGVENVVAIGQHSEHLVVAVILQADGAGGVLRAVRKRAALRVDELRVGLESGLVEPGHGRPLGAIGPRLVARLLLRRDGGRAALLPSPMHSHAHVRRQHDRRHQHQNAHGYGDPVPQPHSAHVRSERRRRAVGTHRRRSLNSSIMSYPPPPPPIAR
ncbi:hypothetical protein AXG93_3437s1100 [Marchantia polymorpha subsp. ruderalis]|uniref:Uncharacterized protein n=1 Tax=Marchantia polymorpha subsp. ruderalis TaxID=1480154 RepID=A0A176W0R8_MARPO|nr:hypothetical protein AXG93_3437s1100 [Marchantia polymorpha subsp. ruderalis]